jgi:serine/threonine protein kinase/tetratricopeptide (TPR) repeat protein
VSDQPKLVANQRVAHYQIVKLLGKGGMGEVYLAEDTKLGRKVALKFLPHDFTEDEERVRRFAQEARAASALNHPNIFTIHEIGEADGRQFIATEFVDGQTLRQQISAGSLEMSEVLNIAEQIASALNSAHAAGIVHRDIKPENVILRNDGLVKVLDFGLAKLIEQSEAGPDDETRKLIKTSAGVVLGTAPYMSPEQARGLPVDARSDIFSLGAVIYEMVSGRRPFAGETSSDLLVAILKTEPTPLSRFSPEVPAELQRIVRKALTKDRDTRYQTARDLMVDLKSLRRDLDIQSEVKRTTASGISDSAKVADNEDAGVAPAVTDPTFAKNTQTVSQAHSQPDSTPGAKRFVAAIKEHKLAAIIVVVILVAGMISLAYLQLRTPTVAINSIAVLPFINASNDPNAEYFSDGMTESIINSLSQLPHKKILARATVFRYKGQEVDLRKIGNELGVDALLTGRVTQQGDTLTIQADLVRVADGSELWGGRYNKKLADIFAVQNEIANEISETLRLKLNSDEQKRVTRHYTDNVEAYQLYLKGRFEVNKYTREGVAKGIEYYNRAITIDPTYALAYAGLADLYALQAHVWVLPKEGYAKAKWAAEKAILLDDALPEAHNAMGLVNLYYDWDFPTAEKEFKRAIALNPNFSDAHSAYSAYFKALRRYPEEIAEAKRGQELDPLSAFTNMELGEAFYHARRYDEAIEQIRKSLELDPHLFVAYHVRARAYEQKKMYAEAIADCQEWGKIFHDDPFALATLAHVYATMGKRREAEEILNKLQEISKQRYFSPYWIAVVYAGLGDNDQAFQYFEKAFDDRYFLMIWMNSDPRFDNLRADPRFANLMQRIGLTQ